MKKITLLIAIILCESACFRLLAQQLNFVGVRVMHVTGPENIFVGRYAGYNNSSGSNNSFLGNGAGFSNTTGTFNTFIGYNAGYSSAVTNRNAFIGYKTGSNNTEGNDNTFIGFFAGTNNVSGSANMFIGAGAGFANTSGGNNNFLGVDAGHETKTGHDNTFVGTKAGFANNDGSFNTFIGPGAGYLNANGNNNTLIGAYTDVASVSVVNATALGASAKVAVSNAIVLGDPNNTSISVGIGTDSPQFPLDVRGTINLRNNGRIKFAHLSNPLFQGTTDQFLTVNEVGETVLARYRLRIDNVDQWSDRVFSPAYVLRPLASVADYIRQHNHLPGVPSDEQIVREGIDPAEMDAKLLEKIEELTLYSIQLERRIEQLNQEKRHQNQQQQGRLERLEQLVNHLLKK